MKKAKKLGKDGKVSKEDAFKLHQEYAGQTLQTTELEEMFNSCNVGEDGMVHFGTFLGSKSRRNLFHENQLKEAFVMLSEDADESLNRLQSALSFSANL